MGLRISDAIWWNKGLCCESIVNSIRDTKHICHHFDQSLHRVIALVVIIRGKICT